MVVINKEISTKVPVLLRVPGARDGKAKIVRLLAGGMAAKEGILLGGAGIDKAGVWAPSTQESASVRAGAIRVALPFRLRSSCDLIELSDFSA